MPSAHKHHPPSVRPSRMTALLPLRSTHASQTALSSLHFLFTDTLDLERRGWREEEEQSKGEWKEQNLETPASPNLLTSWRGFQV